MKLNLVPMTGAHAEIFQRWRNEGRSQKYNPLENVDLETLRERLDVCLSDLSDLRANARYRWMVYRDEEPVANVALNNVNLSMAVAEIGYGVGEAYQGCGIGTASVAALAEMVFAQTKLRKLIAYVHSENVASCRILEKLGFVREGLLREHYLINGEPVDEILFGLLRREWKAPRF